MQVVVQCALIRLNADISVAVLLPLGFVEFVTLQTLTTMAGESSSAKANGAAKAALPLDVDGHNLPPSPAPSSPRNGRKYALMTELVYTESTDQYNASSVPIYQVGKLSRE